MRAQVVVLAASACESARLLLNSKSTRHPDGLANASGTVGRYLTDTTGTSVHGHIPALEGLPPHNEDGVGGMHVYMPWWLDNQKLDFPRGYHIEPWGGRDMPGFGFMGGIHRCRAAATARSSRTTTAGSTARSSASPAAARCSRTRTATASSTRRGGPLRDPGPALPLEVVGRRAEPGAPHARASARVIEEMGGKALGTSPDRDKDYGLKPGGEIIHEAGTTRMGASPRTSVLNAWCQAHDCKNLFVADSGPFVSNAHKNMTWTILALSMRTSEHIAEERRKGNL